MKKKRQFELISAIIGIVLGVIIGLSGLLVCAAPDSVAELIDTAMLEQLGMTFDELKATFVVVGVMFSILGAGEIVVGALLCTGKFTKARKGLGLASCILLGIMLLLYLSSSGLTIILALAAALALSLEIASLNARDNPAGGVKVTAYYYPDGSVRSGNGYQQSSVHIIDPFEETQPVHESQKPNENSIDSKLADLKKLHDEGVITDEQYRSAADKLVKSALGITDEPKPEEKQDDVKEVDAEFPEDK